MKSIFRPDEDETEAGVQPPTRTLSERPGRLHGETRMTIQTRHAQNLITGRSQSQNVERIIGLSDFGRRMGLLWQASQADDPYADWFLLKVEESFDESKAHIKEKTAWLDGTLTAMDGIEIDTAYSIQPIHVPLTFPNPYGYLGAYLVLDYDQLARRVFTAQHTGLIHRETAANTLDSAGRLLRRTFLLSMEWTFTGVTRRDLDQMNQIAERAKTAHLPKYGECPTEIVNKEQRATHAPFIRENIASTRQATSPGTSVQDEVVDPGNKTTEEVLVSDGADFLKRATLDVDAHEQELVG